MVHVDGLQVDGRGVRRCFVASKSILTFIIDAFDNFDARIDSIE